ncbi:chromobox protein homolog 5-like [Rhizophagus clarus]|uniref:Chromobox protein homolog 5-like n=1 Tax=Rhizophagus clarus TaxID=94130 RepID=A0A8H3R799_9GLOM|nr:chromobox protein homolog 5-like [Rhizophagus clarus]
MIRFGKPELRLIDEQWQRDLPKIPEGPPKIDKNTELLTGDIKWNPKVCIIKKLILSPEQLPTYLLDRPHGRLGVFRCAYTRKELQVISINKKPPPDSVIRRQPERYIPEKILKHRIRKGQLQYLVKWERYSEDESTWKPADRLQEDVPNLIRIYNDTK